MAAPENGAITSEESPETGVLQQQDEAEALWPHGIPVGSAGENQDKEKSSHNEFETGILTVRR
jgi:hypothetical protein